MTVSLRTLDELSHAPQMATLSALSAAIHAVRAALDLTHPTLLSRPSTCPMDVAALLLLGHLDECQALLRTYDELFFDQYDWSDGDSRELDEPDDDIPF